MIALADSATMLRRNLKHMLRYPSMILFMVLMPVLFLLLFVYILGGTVGPIGHTGRAAYATFITPGVIVLTAVGTTTATAVSVASDMTGGIVARFRTMPIARVSILAGHVGGAVIQTVLCMIAVTAIALLTGFRTQAGPGAWLAAAGILVLLVFALTWLSVALGLAAKNVESASNMPMPLVVLPFLGSAFVPTHSLPAAVRWFAEYQPFTPVINTVRGLLTGGPIGSNAAIAVAWSAAIALAGYLWARKLFSRDPSNLAGARTTLLAVAIDEACIGRVGVLTVATRGSGGPGEVHVRVRGGRESFIAWSDEPLPRGSNVLIVNSHGTRAVQVVPWEDVLGDSPNLSGS